MPSMRWIVGVDPGTVSPGVAVLEENVESRTGLRLVEHELIKVEGQRSFRLYWIHDRLTKLFQRLEAQQPGRRMDVAVEYMFVGSNAKTSMIMGEARGVILAAAGAVPKARIYDYPPSSMKLEIAGHGHAEKPQVAAAVSLLLGLDELLPFDVADAAGLAILHSRKV